MSCFEGRIKELKNVSIDCFENSNIYSTAYFLSHCHSGMYDTNLLHLIFYYYGCGYFECLEVNLC